MRTSLLIASLSSVILLASPAISLQIGPEIRIGPHEATFGGAGVKDGKPVAPNVDQVIDNFIINSTPAAILSTADKNNIKNAIKTTGYVATITSDPVLGFVVISVLEGGNKKDVPVPEVNAEPTGKTWNLTAKCIVQQDGGLITAMFNDDPAHIDNIRPGDTLNLKSNTCAEYQKRSVTAVTIKFTGRSDYSDATPPTYKHYIVGRTA